MLKGKRYRLECSKFPNVIQVFILQPEKIHSTLLISFWKLLKVKYEDYVFSMAVPEKVPYPTSDNFQARKDRSYCRLVQIRSFPESQNCLHPRQSQYHIYTLQTQWKTQVLMPLNQDILFHLFISSCLSLLAFSYHGYEVDSSVRDRKFISQPWVSWVSPQESPVYGYIPVSINDRRESRCCCSQHSPNNGPPQIENSSHHYGYYCWQVLQTIVALHQVFLLDQPSQALYEASDICHQLELFILIRWYEWKKKASQLPEEIETSTG